VRTLWLLLRQQRDLRQLVGANVISQTGDWMLHIGVAFYVYDLTGSTLASAGTMFATFLPSILLSSFAGVFVDRWNRKITMVSTDLLMVFGLAPLLLVDRPRDVWIVYVVTAFEGIVSMFWRPAEQALLPHLVPDDELIAANALNGQTREVARLVGSAIGGLVVATGGITALAFADAATFIVSAALVGRISVSGRVEPSGDRGTAPELVEPAGAALDGGAGDVPASPDGSRSSLRSLGHEWGEGLRVAMSKRELVAVFVFTMMVMTGEGLMGTLFVPFVRDVLRGSGTDYGLIVSVQAIGGITGGLVAAGIAQRLSAAAMFGFGALLFGLVDLVMFLYPLVWVEVWPAAVCMIVVGVPGAIAMAGYTTLLQRNTSDAYRGRVFGALGAVHGIAIVVGTTTAGFLGESVGIVPIIALHGAGGMVAGVVVLSILRDQVGRTPPLPAAATADREAGR
jgi:predicted MFS family arabinose efflux permease